MHCSFTLLTTLLFLAVTSAYGTLPPVPWQESESNARGFSGIGSPKIVYIDRDFASRRDRGGLTLIPPTAFEFAENFRHDLEHLYGCDWALQYSDGRLQSLKGIFLTAFDDSGLAYESGELTDEGYKLEIGDGIVRIGGSGARGMWWGTRTLLQLLGHDGAELIPPGQVVDAPAYRTRGFMIDAGRKWYSLDFIKELCSYASFFKMSEFHYHASDNYPLSRGRNESWQDIYSHFSLYPESSALQGIIERPNETLSRQEFEDFQRHCAGRGVTVIPEIEAPGHCLAITKWKPELALAKRDLLNLSHSDAIPTVKSLWAEFLPWFATKEVHIGADEYDPDLADDYIKFVNEMAEFVNATSGKRIRIWGTYEPSENLTIRKDVIVQHWQYGQSEPVQLEADGYDVVNSEDWWAYVTTKNDHTPILPAPYPQFFNTARVLNFAGRPGWQWEPSLYNPVNATMQLPSGSTRNKGAIMAAWNDNGPDATTQLEMYYAIRKGIPLVAARAWSGSRGPQLEVDGLDETVERLISMAPAQNLDRRLPVARRGEEPLFSWMRSDASGDTAILGQGSAGVNRTLIIDADGPFELSSSDGTLALRTDGGLMFTADGREYPLRSVSEADGFDPGHPGRIWVNATASTHELVTVPLRSNIEVRTDEVGGSRVWVDGVFKGRFEVFVFGGRNTQFSWSQMAFAAPLDVVKGGVRRVEVSRWEAKHPW